MAMSEVISPPITLRRGEVDAIVGKVLGGASYGEGEQITPPPTAEGPSNHRNIRAMATGVWYFDGLDRSPVSSGGL